MEKIKDKAPNPDETEKECLRYKKIYESLLAEFLKETSLSEDKDDVKIDMIPTNGRNEFLITLSGPAEGSLDSEEFKFDELKDRDDMIAARKVRISGAGKTVYLDRAKTIPKFHQHGAYRLLLAYVLFKYPNINKIIVPTVAGVNYKIFREAGMNQMPLVKILKYFNFKIQSFRLGELVATKVKN